ncbi:MAG: hypothetical protein LBB04_00250 [Oscillospiraceae bacterium]|nr:hypothetical protein [Oscillospiraceae bacterium]
MAVKDFRLVARLGTFVETSKEMFDRRVENLVNKDVSGYKAKFPVLGIRPSNSVFGKKFRGEFVRGRSMRTARAAANGGFGTLADSIDGTGFDADDELSGAVVIEKMLEDQTPCEREYDPENPEADEDGWVTGSNVSETKELLAMIDAGSGVDVGLRALKVVLETGAQSINMGKS